MSNPVSGVWYTPRQIGELLGVHPINIRKLITSGELEAVNAGLGVKKPSWRISQEAFLAFCESRKNTPAAKKKETKVSRKLPTPAKNYF